MSAAITPTHRDLADGLLPWSLSSAQSDTLWRRLARKERVAQAIADAEVRGPAGGRADPTDAEERAHRGGIESALRGVWLHASEMPLTLPERLAVRQVVRDQADAWGVSITG